MVGEKGTVGSFGNILRILPPVPERPVEPHGNAIPPSIDAIRWPVSSAAFLSLLCRALPPAPSQNVYGINYIPITSP